MATPGNAESKIKWEIPKKNATNEALMFQIKYNIIAIVKIKNILWR